MKILVFLLAMFYATTIQALELLMAHNPKCHICNKFMDEVAIDYDNKELPLVIINLYNQPEWFKEAYAQNRIIPIRGTPTFIIWNGRKELVRLVGYSNKERFYRRVKDIFLNEK